jgi:hypothetical protein
LTIRLCFKKLSQTCKSIIHAAIKYISNKINYTCTLFLNKTNDQSCRKKSMATSISIRRE